MMQFVFLAEIVCCSNAFVASIELMKAHNLPNYLKLIAVEKRILSVWIYLCEMRTHYVAIVNRIFATISTNCN